MAFFAAYPEEKKKGFCRSCYEERELIPGVSIGNWGIRLVLQCTVCRKPNVIREEESDPLWLFHNKLDAIYREIGEINNGIDRLLRVGEYDRDH